MVKHNIIATTGDEVSLLGFGGMRLPKQADGKIDRAEAERMIDAAMKAGINYYDTSYVYHDGESEVVMGKLLSKYPRESYYIVDKLPVWLCRSTGDPRNIFEEELARCGVEYFDYYLEHSLDAEGYANMCDSNSYPYLCAEKAAGRIKHLGFSFHGDIPLMKELLSGKYEWDFAQIELNYLDWTEQQADVIYGMLKEKGLPIIVMEPVRGGFLANLPTAAANILQKADPEIPFAEWAFRWLFKFDNIMTILSGMSNTEQLRRNISTFSAPLPLDALHEAALERAAAALSALELVPCTACAYCMPCPFGVDIPGMLKIYNKFLEDKSLASLQSAYQAAPPASRSENCTSCGACESVCPQAIPAYEHLLELTKAAGKH